MLIKDIFTLSVFKYDSCWCFGFQWVTLWRSDKFLLTLSVLFPPFLSHRSYTKSWYKKTGRTVYHYEINVEGQVNGPVNNGQNFEHSYSAQFSIYFPVFFTTMIVLTIKGAHLLRLMLVESMIMFFSINNSFHISWQYRATWRRIGETEWVNNVRDIKTWANFILNTSPHSYRFCLGDIPFWLLSPGYVLSIHFRTNLPYTWQKEASDKLSKKFIFNLSCSILADHLLCRNTFPAERYSSQYVIILHWCQCHKEHNVLHIYKKYQICHLFPFAEKG